MNEDLTYDELIPMWERIGLSNAWIAEAIDPPFNRNRLQRCDSVAELRLSLSRANWSLGQGFYYQNLCFINQIDGGDEWLAIRGSIKFDSINATSFIKKGSFETLIDRMLKASTAQLRNLTY